MTRCDAFYQWRATVATHLPHLTKPQSTVLALWSFGMVLAHSCALTAVAGFMADLCGQTDNTMRQRLREWCYDAADKRGTHRISLDVSSCFVPLLRWVLSLWQGTRLALALDATSLGDRFVVLVVSVLYRGCALPVAWTVLPANTPGEWRREWLWLLRMLQPAIPRSFFVVVLADRGLYALTRARSLVLPPGRTGANVSSSAHVRSPGGNTLVSLWDRLQDEGLSSGLYTPRHVARRATGTLVSADRPLATGGRCRLVWLAYLDRTELQTDEARRLAMAAYTYDRPRAGRTAVGSRGSGDLVASERGRGGGPSPAREHHEHHTRRR
jgi:hypothetical protein